MAGAYAILGKARSDLQDGSAVVADQRGSRLSRQIKNPYELVARRLRRTVQEEETARLAAAFFGWVTHTESSHATQRDKK
jgi:hypothetical protein